MLLFYQLTSGTPEVCQLLADMAEKDKLVLCRPLYVSTKKTKNNRAALRQCSSTYGSKGQRSAAVGTVVLTNTSGRPVCCKQTKKVLLPQDEKRLPRTERPTHPPRTTQRTLHPPTDQGILGLVHSAERRPCSNVHLSFNNQQQHARLGDNRDATHTQVARDPGTRGTRGPGNPALKIPRFSRDESGATPRKVAGVPVPIFGAGAQP